MSILQSIEELCECTYNPAYLINSTFKCTQSSKMAVTFQTTVLGLAQWTADEIVTHIHQIRDTDEEDPTSSPNAFPLMYIIVGGAGGVVLVLLLLGIAGMGVCCCCSLRKRKTRRSMRLNSFK